MHGRRGAICRGMLMYKDVDEERWLSICSRPSACDDVPPPPTP